MKIARLQKYNRDQVHRYECEDYDEIIDDLVRRNDYDHVTLSESVPEVTKLDKWVALSTELVPWSNILWYRYQGIWADDIQKDRMHTVYLVNHQARRRTVNTEFKKFDKMYQRIDGSPEVHFCGVFIDSHGFFRLPETYKDLLRKNFPNLV